MVLTLNPQTHNTENVSCCLILTFHSVVETWPSQVWVISFKSGNLIPSLALHPNWGKKGWCCTSKMGRGMKIRSSVITRYPNWHRPTWPLVYAGLLHHPHSTPKSSRSTSISAMLEFSGILKIPGCFLNQQGLSKFYKVSSSLYT